MTKSRWRESIRCLGSSHTDPEKDEQLKKTKLGVKVTQTEDSTTRLRIKPEDDTTDTKKLKKMVTKPAIKEPKAKLHQRQKRTSLIVAEVDDKVAKIFKLIKNKNQRKKDGNSTKDSELVELIGDFHKQYQSLYLLYENLRGEVKEKVLSLENKESSSSTSSSDAESDSFYSVDEASTRSSPKHDHLQKARDEFKHKLETSTSEFVDLRNKLNSMTEEKEAIQSEYMISLSKIEESESIIKELRNKVEITESTKQKIVDECMQLKEKLVERENELLSLTKADQVHEPKVPNRIKGLERQISSLKLDRKNLRGQKRELEEKAKAQGMETKQLGEENSGLQARILELEITSKEKEDELSVLMSKLEESGRISDSKVQDLIKRVKDLQLEVDSLMTQKEEIDELVLRSKQLEKGNSDLQTRIAELELISKEKEETVSALQRKVEGNESSSKSEIEDFMARANGYKGEINELVLRSKQLEEENSGLQTHIAELELASKEKEETISALVRKIEENERSSKSEIEDLMARANGLRLEVDTLRSQKGILEEQVVVKSNEASNQVKGLMDHVNVLQQELHSLSSQKSESELTIEKVTQEISDFLLQIENLRQKLERKTIDLQIMLQEKEGLQRKVKDLELEVSSIRNQKSEVEEKMRVEKEELHVRVTELEESFSVLENDSSIQIKALGEELKNLQQELDSLHAEKTQLQLETVREKQELSENLALMGKQNIELTSKISEQQKSLKGQEDAINKLHEEHNHSKSQYLIAEKKIEETAEEFCKKFEDSLRIMSRRIRVAEQLHLENKDVYVKTKEKHEKENKELNVIIETTQFAVKKMKEITLTANDALFGLDTVALKFEECSGNFMNRISKASCEVLFAKDWVRRKNNAIKHVQEDVDCLLVQLDTKEAEVLGLREKVWKLENKARELEKMVKEKEEGMLGMGEEKREAIRQLCVWIDYHRSRSDYLKKVLTEMSAVRSHRTS
ncbi:hypothetical protein RHMOL_Rhmol02G0300300 [Rhododendron molle]|nr:hypothetical protein RHMOL_Rhmol02G0300300 [Rhododendron molle]